jgi:hypothetical protein
MERSFGKGAGIFFAKVVDNKDPTENGRYKIRVFGAHDDETNVSEEHLFWAKTMMPATSASLGGIGVSPTGLLANTVVMGMWLDNKRTIPMILGSAHGNKANTEATSATGQTSDDPSTDNDVNPLVRTSATEGGTDTTFDTLINPAVSSHTATYLPSQTHGGKVQYPFGEITKTVGGLEIFVNNTPGSETLRVTHKSGSYYEFTADGKYIQRSKLTSHIAADSDTTFSGKGNSNSKLVGNSLRTVGGSDTKTVAGNINSTTTQGNITQTASAGSHTMSSSTGTSISSSGGNVTMMAGNPGGSGSAGQMVGKNYYTAQMGGVYYSGYGQMSQAEEPGSPPTTPTTPSSSSSGTGTTVSLTPQGVFNTIASKAVSMIAANTASLGLSDAGISLSVPGMNLTFGPSGLSATLPGGMSLSFNPTTGLSATIPGGPSISMNPTTGPSIAMGSSSISINPTTGAVAFTGTSLTFNGTPIA